MKKLIVIPFNIPWEWSTDYTNQTAFILAKDNIVICYMWCEASSIKEYLQKRKFPRFIKRHSKNIYLFYPTLLIPFRRFGEIASINEKISLFLLKVFAKFLETRNRVSKKMLWIFDPKLYPLTQKFGKDYFLLFDCVDYFIGTSRTKSEKKILIKYEHDLVDRADLVTANSVILLKHLQKIRKDVHLVPQGFRVDSFKKHVSNIIKIKRNKRPLIGFLGAINYRIDFDLLYNLAKRNLKWDFALWGPVLEPDLLTPSKQNYYNKLIKLPNVMRGQSDKSGVPGIIRQFDVGMIPYDISIDFNKYCYPMKLFEYFYLGKPVISTQIEELKRFPKFVKIGGNYKDWEKIILGLLSKRRPEKYKEQQKKLAVENGWENKIKIICQLLSPNFTTDIAMYIK